MSLLREDGAYAQAWTQDSGVAQAADLARLAAVMRQIGRTGRAMAAAPPPACADPSGNWGRMTSAMEDIGAQAAGVGRESLPAVRQATADISVVGNAAQLLTGELSAAAG